MTADACSANDRKSPSRNLPRFPVRWILEQPRIENWIVKAVWFAIPIEYYLVTTFSSGFDASAFGAAAVFSLLYLMLLFAVSCVLAIPGKKQHYDSRVRIWSIALIVTWGASVALVAAITFLSRIAGSGNDIIAKLICPCVPEYPARSLKTFVIYFAYTAIALALVWVGSRYLRWTKPIAPTQSGDQDWSEPNLVTVGLINAMILTGMHGWANSG